MTSHLPSVSNYKITVAVVCLNEEKNIAACLGSLLHQSYPKSRYEILVIDNSSTDATLKIIKTIQKRSKLIRLVTNPRPGIAASRNSAVSHAAGQLLAFTDADCIAPPHWLAHLVKGFITYHLKDPQVVAVGGGNHPPGHTAFGQSLGLMLNSFIGSRGSVQGRCFAKDRYVPHLPCVNVMFKKSVIRQVKGFDDNLGNIIEDEDLTYRLTQKGYHFVYLADTSVVHKVAHSYRSWAKKMFTYGKGRIWFLSKYPEKWHLFFLIPLLLALFSPITLFIYLPLIFIYSLIMSITFHKIRLSLQLTFLYFLTHYFYGFGQIYALLINRKKFNHP